ncbi:hypothetical protein, partial [Lactococcus petauri]|uniref:hypothetical protein n=1 Tax=Lactococcus petauri TaxID=1940789 RepID=UPI00254B7A43
QNQFLQNVHSKIKTLYIDPKHNIRAQWLSVSQNPVWRKKNPEPLLYGAKLDRTTRFWYHSSDSAGFSQHLPFTTTKSGSDSGFP